MTLATCTFVISPFLTVGENVNVKIFRVRVRVMSPGTVLTVTRT
jgi:hypothetical protein